LNFILHVFNYFKYYFRSINEHGAHSPFLFKLLTNVVYVTEQYYDYKNLSKIRAQLLFNPSVLKVQDYGAGSRIFTSNQRKIKDIAKHGISSVKYAELLFRLVNYFKPITIVELGTSLGLTTMYLAAANKNATVYTLEGSTEIADFAKKQFIKNDFQNIHLIEGDFKDTLPKLLLDLPSVDFAYIDGNHTKEATLNYFNQLLTKCNENSVLVFDDINWSKDMQEAWQYIKQHPQVKLSVDFFFMGLVLFRKEQIQKEDFVVRF